MVAFKRRVGRVFLSQRTRWR